MHVTAHVGAGHLIVTVPQDVEVRMSAHVGMGQIQCVDNPSTSGLDITKSLSADAVGTSRGIITLDVKVGVGDVEVDRATS